MRKDNPKRRHSINQTNQQKDKLIEMAFFSSYKNNQNTNYIYKNETKSSSICVMLCIYQ